MINIEANKKFMFPKTNQCPNSFLSSIHSKISVSQCLSQTTSKDQEPLKVPKARRATSNPKTLKTPQSP